MRMFIAGLKFIAWFSAGIAGFAAAGVVALWFWVARELPDPRAVLALEAETCPDGAAGRNLHLAELPPFVAEAFVAAEQPGYWQQRSIPTLRELGNAMVDSARASIFAGQAGCSDLD